MVRRTASDRDSSPGRHRRRAALLAALVVLPAVAVGLPSAGAAAAQGDTSVAFGDDPDQTVAVGDRIEPYPILLSGTDTATLAIVEGANASDSYSLNVTVRDSDGDGRVSVGLNTFRAGHSNPWIVTGGTIVDYDHDSLPEGELMPKTVTYNWLADEQYNVSLGAGDDPSATIASPSATGALTVGDGESEGFDVATAPGDREYETLEDIYRAPDAYADLRRSLSREGDQVVADGDTVLFNPWGGGFYGMVAVARERTESREAAFAWLLERGFMEFELRQTNAGGADPKRLNVSAAIERGALEFAAGPEYHHLLLSVRTDAAVFQRGGTGELVEIEPFERYRARFAKARRVDPAESDGFGADLNVSVVPRSLSLDDPSRTLENGTIGGTSTMAPGTNLTVSVQVGSDESTLARYETAVEKRNSTENLPADIAAGVEETRWSVAPTLGDVDPEAVRVSVVAADGEHRRSSPPAWRPPPPAVETTTLQRTTGSPTTTASSTAVPGSETTAPGATTAPGSATATTMRETPSGGDGGTLPGFTPAVVLLAGLVVLLVASRRE